MTIALQKPGHQWQKLWKWTSIFLASQLILWGSNAALALIYKRFEWRVGPVDQILYFVLIALIVNLLRRINQQLDTTVSWKGGISRRLFTQVLVNLSLTVFVVVLVRNLLLAFFSWSGARLIRLQDEGIIFLVFWVVVMVIALIDLGIYLMQQWQATATEAERVKKENMEFRFDRLRNQINPHFLFNSLNTLASLVFQNPETASQFVRQLARVYRYVLENKDKELIRLSEEWEFMEAYLFLVKIRFEEGLRLEVKMPEESMSLLIPPMTLQLLVENALKHNVVSAQKPLKLSIRVEDGYLIVENNFQPKLSPEPSTKTGLENIRTRYAMMTNRPLRIESDPERFIVSIPLLEEEINLEK